MGSQDIKSDSVNSMQKKSILYVNITVLLFGLAGLFAKWVSIPALGITFGRVLFSSVSLLIFLLAAKQPIRLQSRKDTALMVCAGVTLALHWWSFLGSIQLSTVAIGTVTFSSFPLFVTFLEPVIFHEKLRAKNIVVAIIILIGVIITVPEFSLENQQFQGIAVGMISSLTYAVLTLFNKFFSRRYSATLIAFYEQSSAAVVLLPLFLASGIRPSVIDIGLLAVLGIFMTALAHTLFINSLKHIPAQLAGICSSMETVYGILLALIILGEVPGLRECLGAAVIIGTVAYSQLQETLSKGHAA